MSDIPVIKCKRGKDDRFCTLKKVVSSTAETVELPKYADGRYITSIGGGAFKKCPRLKTLVIPDTVTTIEPKAFEGSNLEVIVIPSSVTEIGDRAFDKCVYLRDVTIENPDAKIGKFVFSGCYNIRRVKLPVAAFDGRWFTSVEQATVIGNGEIPEEKFKDCGNLKKVIIGEGIDVICEYAFSSCEGLEEVVLPDSLTEIEAYAFENCKALKSFTVPKNVSDIGYGILSGSAVERLRVDKDNAVFHSDGDCIIRTAAKELVAGCAVSVIPNDGSVQIIEDRAFNDCVGLVAIVVPSAIRYIGDGAFSWCENLETAVLSEGVEAVFDFAFSDCPHLQSVKLPSTLKELGFGVFDECEWLSDVYYNGTVADWYAIQSEYASACNSSFVLHCTDGDINDYK